MIQNLFHYTFIIRGLEAGILIALIAPLIGIFLVLRRYSLIADTLAHVSLAGIAIGLIAGINPVVTALGTSIVSSLGIERLRLSKRVYGESALALFLSGSLALAVVLLSLAHGLDSNLVNYLFGSIVTVTRSDVFIIAVLAIVVFATITFLYRDFVYTTFDEDAAQISGINVKRINKILILLSALTVSLSIPVVGVLLISALIVIPVITALQLKKNFIQTILWAEAVSLFSVISGIIISFYCDLSTGGTIVLIMLALFGLVFFVRPGK